MKNSTLIVLVIVVIFAVIIVIVMNSRKQTVATPTETNVTGGGLLGTIINLFKSKKEQEIIDNSKTPPDSLNNWVYDESRKKWRYLNSVTGQWVYQD